MLDCDRKDRSVTRVRRRRMSDRSKESFGSIEQKSQLPSSRTRDCERWKWYSPYSRCRYLTTGLPSSSLLLFILWLILLRSLRVYLSLRSRFLFDSYSFRSGICTIRKTWHCIRRWWLRLRYSHLRRITCCPFVSAHGRWGERPMLCVHRDRRLDEN